MTSKLTTTVSEAFAKGLAFVALNDDPSVLKIKDIANTMSVITLSEAFGIDAREIARSIQHIRKVDASLELIKAQKIRKQLDK